MTDKELRGRLSDLHQRIEELQARRKYGLTWVEFSMLLFVFLRSC